MSAIIRYSILAIASAGVTVGVTAFSHEILNAKKEIAYFSALICAILFNFSGMRWFAFRSTKSDILPQFFRFLFANIFWRIAEWTTFYVLHMLSDVFYLFLVIAISLISTIIKFYFYRTRVFGENKNIVST